MKAANKAKYDLGRELLWPYQKKFLLSKSRDIVLEWARGNGKTAAVACKIALETFKSQSEGRSEDWLIASATREQAKEAIDKVAGWCKAFLVIAADSGAVEPIEELATAKLPDGSEIKFNRWVIRIGRQRILAQAASPAAARGYTANIWWDEAAHHPDGAEMYEALRHCTRGYYRMIVSGTPWGDKDNQFYKLVHNTDTHDGQDLWDKSIVDIHEAVRQGRIYCIDREQKQSDPDKWDREMLLKWIDGAAQWLPGSLLDKAESSLCTVDGSGATLGRSSQFFIGNDIGLRGDLWVAWVLQVVDGVRRTVEVVTMARQDFEAQHEEIYRLMRKYNAVKLYIDQGGLGEETTEIYMKKYGTRVEGIIFNLNNKGAMALQVKTAMQGGTLLIPQNQHEIRSDLQSVTKVVSPAGNVLFKAQRKDAGHADRYTALALANAAAEDNPPTEGFRSRGTRRSERAGELAGY